MLLPEYQFGIWAITTYRMTTYMKDQYGYIWMSVHNNTTAYRRQIDKFKIDNLENYQHSIHSVEARVNLKKKISKDRRTKFNF